jgi:Ca2+-binding RTX toxin-like protein
MAAGTPTTPFLPGKSTYGTDGNDVITTTETTVSVDARAGDDLIVVTNSVGKALTVLGNLGNDTVSYEGASGVTIDLTDPEANAGAAQGHVFHGIENIVGTAQGDRIVGDAHANRFYGGLGIDRLFGGAGNDTLDGGGGRDYLYGEGGRDTLYGRDGNDVLDGGTGNDVIDGGAGDDSVTFGGVNATDGVVLDVAAGTSTSAYFGSDAFVSIEFFQGSILADVMHGDDTANVFSGEGGSDDLRGGGGDDLLFGGNGADMLNGGTGIDTAYYEWGNANLGTGTGDAGDGQSDTLTGLENLLGGPDDNDFVGNNQDNVLDGGFGNDTLDGRRGDDTLIGDAGEDIFVFDQGGLNGDDDVVQDFAAGIDRLDFSDSSIGDLDEFFDNAEQVGADVVIDTGLGTITLLNVQLSALSAGDLIF